MTTYQIISLLFGSGLLLALWRYITGRIKAVEQKNEAICLGVQALLRDRLLQSYEYHKTKGYASVDAKDNFENMWTQYHALGVNGVMDGVHKEFMFLPTKPEA